MKRSLSHSAETVCRRLAISILSVLCLAGPALAAPNRPNARTQKDITYATVDGVDLKLDMYIPENTEGPLPLVVWIHGGGWQQGDKARCPAVRLVDEGFVVASINYRLTDVAIFPAQIHDCKAAIRFLRANAPKYHLDPDRIGVWGGSAGGHLVALLGTTNGNKALEGAVGNHTDVSSDVQAVCDWFGPADMQNMPVNPQRYPEGENPVFKLLGGRPADKPELAALCSPVVHISPNDPPFLIMHGDQDNLVPLKQSRQFYDQLKAAGVDAQLIVMEGQGHGFAGPKAIDPVMAFFKRTLIDSQQENEPMFEKDTIPTENGDLTLTFIGHGTLMFQWAGKTIHIDPWTNLADYTQLPDADIILITHEHRDHLDPKAIEAVRKETTTVIAPPVADLAAGTVMQNGDRQTVNGITIQAVPAYNIAHTRGNGQPYHPKGRGNGYVLTFADTRVYVAGDTENIPEMADLKDIDVAFLPMNLPYTMTPEMAADAARTFKPKILYPYHYGETDVNKLTQLLKDEKQIDVRIRKMQ